MLVAIILAVCTFLIMLLCGLIVFWGRNKDPAITEENVITLKVLKLFDFEFHHSRNGIRKK